MGFEDEDKPFTVEKTGVELDAQATIIGED